MQQPVKSLYIVDEHLEFMNQLCQIRDYFGDDLKVTLSCDMDEAIQACCKLGSYDLVLLVVQSLDSNDAALLLEANLKQQSSLNIGLVYRRETTDKLQHLIDLNMSGAFTLDCCDKDLIDGLREMLAGQPYFPELTIETMNAVYGSLH